MTLLIVTLINTTSLIKTILITLQMGEITLMTLLIVDFT
jgi:hypothetical protein